MRKLNNTGKKLLQHFNSTTLLKNKLHNTLQHSTTLYNALQHSATLYATHKFIPNCLSNQTVQNLIRLHKIQNATTLHKTFTHIMHTTTQLYKTQTYKHLHIWTSTYDFPLKKRKLSNTLPTQILNKTTLQHYYTKKL